MSVFKMSSMLDSFFDVPCFGMMCRCVGGVGVNSVSASSKACLTLSRNEGSELLGLCVACCVLCVCVSGGCKIVSVSCWSVLLSGESGVVWGKGEVSCGIVVSCVLVGCVGVVFGVLFCRSLDTWSLISCRIFGGRRLFCTIARLWSAILCSVTFVVGYSVMNALCSSCLYEVVSVSSLVIV